MSKVTVVYDGACPLCRYGCAQMRLRREAGDLELIDARQPGSTMSALSERGVDLDQGMVAIYQERLYQGAGALSLLARLSNRQGVANRLMADSFRVSRVAVAVYPLLRGMRKLLLWVNNIAPIHNLKKERAGE